MSACNNFVILNLKLETIQMPIRRWMNKQIVAYLYSGILLRYKKEKKTYWYTQYGESQKNYAEWKKSDTEETIHYDSTYVKF